MACHSLENVWPIKNALLYLTTEYCGIEVCHIQWSVYKGAQGYKVERKGMLCVRLSSQKASCTRNVYTHVVYCNTYMESQHVPHSMG